MTNYFQNSKAVEIGLSEFDKICLTVLKVFYIRQKSHISQYQSCKKLSKETFINDFQNTFFNSGRIRKTSFEKIKKTVDVTLNKHTPLKKSFVRAN